MKLMIAKAAHMLQTIDAVLAMQLMEAQLDAVKCNQYSCDLNAKGSCTVGYCRRVERHLIK